MPENSRQTKKHREDDLFLQIRVSLILVARAEMTLSIESSQGERPFLLTFRSSKAFIVFVVSYALFVESEMNSLPSVILIATAQDQFVFAVIVPVMPFALHHQVGVSDASGTCIRGKVSTLLTIHSPVLDLDPSFSLRRGVFYSLT